jgi:hypothetical protein
MKETTSKSCKSEPTWYPITHFPYKMLGFCWTLKGFDGNVEVASYGTNCANNHIKLMRFREILNNNGYKLTKTQLDQIKETLRISFNLVDISKSKLETMLNHIANFEKKFIETDFSKIKNFSDTEKKNYSKSTGVEIHEINALINKYK